jgi:hypothetical protein
MATFSFSAHSLHLFTNRSIGPFARAHSMLFLRADISEEQVLLRQSVSTTEDEKSGSRSQDRAEQLFKDPRSDKELFDTTIVQLIKRCC